MSRSARKHSGFFCPLPSADYFMQLHHKIPQAHKLTAEDALPVQCLQRAFPARSSGRFC